MDAPATALQLYGCERYLKNSNHAPYCACICSHYRFSAHIDANWNVEWRWMKIIETNVSVCVCLCVVSFNHSHSLATISIIFLLVKFEVCSVDVLDGAAHEWFVESECMYGENKQAFHLSLLNITSANESHCSK